MPYDTHISVCICTFKRPHLLDRLLVELDRQETGGLFSYSIIVVDNDSDRSAEAVVQAAQRTSNLGLKYHVEPEQNIALARNRAVKNAEGAFIAFIDDDEFPEPTWLRNLFTACAENKADGVLGPVKPYFETTPPGWIIKSKLCERNSFQTGTILRDSKDTRTGNVLLHRKVFRDITNPFDPRFGRTGGEDSVFFRGAINQGYIFAWCNEACVYESVPPERMTRAYFMKRALLRGMGESKIDTALNMSALKSVIAIFLYTGALPFLFIAGQHLFMKYLIKDCDHLGRILGLCGIKIVQERTF